MSLTGLIWVLNLLQLVARGADRNRFRIRANQATEAPKTGPLVSVLIPARNEGNNIGPCIHTVLSQHYSNLEVIVLDDFSEDETRDRATRAIGNDPRARLLSGQPRPDGWMGKVWACHTLQKHATGDWLLFIDADVRLEPEAIRQALHYAYVHQADGISVFGRLTLGSFWEWVVQPVIGALILQNNDPKEINDIHKKNKVMANGQFILIARHIYDGVGGHESIQSEILDDVAMARRCKDNDHLLHMVYGRELFSCRMYHSLSELWEGWTKNLFAGLHYNLGLAIAVCVGLFVIHLLPFLLFVVSLVTASAPTDPLLMMTTWNVFAMYLAYFVGLVLSDYSPKYFWSYPLGMLISIGLFANSARKIAGGKGVSWKGRTYTQTGIGQNTKEPPAHTR